MNNHDLQIHFQFGKTKYEVELKPQENHLPKESTLIGGVQYSLTGNPQGIEMIKKCFSQLPEDSTKNLLLAGRELKSRLHLAGAKNITLSGSAAAQKLSLQILGDIEPLDIHQVLEDISLSLQKFYFLPDVAKKCSKYLRCQLKKGAYEAISDPETFAQAITADLRHISNDRHITFFLRQQPPVKSEETLIETEQLEELYPIPTLLHSFEYKPNSNIGWMGRSLDDLPYELKGGYLEKDETIGYFDLRVFGVCKNVGKEKDIEMDTDVKERRNAYIEIAEKLKNTESIIIDLRNNGGGKPHAVQLLCSLFIIENLPLNTIEWRKGDLSEREDFYTLPDKDLSHDKRLLEQKIFVLISPETFSAAEEFANNMKVLGRAEIVGEPSGGGANPARDIHPIGNDFELFIPEGQAINPIEEGNWEHWGIMPDHFISAKDALDEAIAFTKK